MLSSATELETTAPSTPISALEQAKLAMREQLENSKALQEAPKINLPEETKVTEVAPESPPANEDAPKVPQEVVSPSVEATTEIDVMGDPKFQSLLAKHREIRQENEKFKAEQARLAEQQKVIELAERIRNKDFRAIEELGISFDDWATHELYKTTGNKPTEELKPEPSSELEAIRKELAEFKASLASKEQEQANEVKQKELENWKNQLFQQINTDPAFKALSVAGLQDKVYNKIVQHAIDTEELTGKAELLDYRKAARAVWDAERKPFFAWLKALTEVDEIKSFLFGAQPAPTPRPAPALTTLLPGELADAPVSTTTPLTHEQKKALVMKALTEQGG